MKEVRRTRCTVPIWLLLLAVAPLARAAEIRHRFLAVDESRKQLLYVDQVDPAKGWTLEFPVRHRDIQLVGKGIVMLSSPDGYREFNLADRRMVKEVQGYPGAMAVRRQPDGRTILACAAKGVTIYELSPEDKPLRKVALQVSPIRLVRLTPQNTFLLGSTNQLIEADWNGATLRKIALPAGAWVYQALRRPDGHLLVAGGYTPAMFELDAEGRVVRTLGGQDPAEAKALGLHFFGAFQVLRSGDIVVCNWTGHGANDSRKGVQILQLNAAGQVVWKWHDPDRAGSINGLVVLDDLDPAVLNDEVSSVLGPVK